MRYSFDLFSRKHSICLYEKIGEGNLEYSPFHLKLRKIIEIIDFKKKRELTGSAPSERTVPSLNRSRDKEFSLQVSDPGQKERDIFLHTP